MARNTSTILLGSAIAVAFSLYLAAPGQNKPIFKGAGIQYGLDLQGGAELLFSPRWESVEDPQLREKLRGDRATLSRIAEITRKRIDVFGLKEIDVRVTDADRIRVELPGQDQAEATRIKELIITAGRLEFRLVAEQETKDRWKYPEAPPGHKWLPYRGGDQGADKNDLIQVEDSYGVSGEDVSDAQVSPGRLGGLQVNFQIRKPKQRDFGRLTGGNLGRNMAIVLDGIIQSAPVLKGEITDSGMIEAGGSAGFSPDQASDLVTVLKTGSLPVALKADSQNVVGPGLGRDAIEAGKVAGIVGTIAVVAVMCVYYLGPGLLTVVGLAVAMSLVVGVLAAFNATLTLSGIAGLVLTLGMAVDANVLIYERIREERRRGLGALEAVTEGFDRATETILDANITTLLTAVILYLVGEGPVQGFAITLSAGIVASVLASLVTTRALFVWLTERGVLRDLRMLDLVGTPSVRFCRYIGPCLAGSALCIVAGLALVAQRGIDNFGLDFRAGTLVQFALREPMPIAEVRGTLAGAEATAADGTKWHPYATAGIKSVYRSWADATGPATEFQVRVGDELQAAAEGGKDVAQIVRGDIQKLFGDRLAPDGLGTGQSLPEGVGWSQTYKVRVPAPFDDLKRAVEKAITDVFTGETFEHTVAKRPVDEKEADVRFVVVTAPRRPLPEGQTRATLQKRLADELAPRVRARLEEDGLAPLPTTEIVAEGGATEKVVHRLPATFRAPVAESVLREVLKNAGYTESEVLIEVAEPDKVAAPADAPATGPLVRAATFVRPGCDPERDDRQVLERQLHDGLAKAEVLLSDPFPQMTNILPAVAKELRQKGTLALLMSLGVILVYIGVRFRAASAAATDLGGLLALLRDLVYRARYGLAAIVALAHDVLFTLGAIALVDHLGWIDAKIDLPMVAALLAIVGYSLNDTIIVFDRIRENLRKSAGGTLREIIDRSVNQTLARTLLTSGTTIVAVLALLVFGADSTRGFSFAMLAGVGVGTYSSIFVASPLLLLWEKREEAAPMAAKAA